MARIKAFLTRLTLDQWQAIDAEYRRESLPDPRAVWVLVTAAVALVLGRYLGQDYVFNELTTLREWFSGLPYPRLHPHVYWGLFKLIYYALLPMLCIAFVLKRPLRDFGLQWTGTRKVGLAYAGMLAVVAPFVYWASTTPAFQRTYPKFRGAGDSIAELLIWEATYALQFVALEFFFRGFLIFALARYIGSLAIFVMVVPYALIHFSKPFAECMGSIIAGIALGTIALRTGSIWGGAALHVTVGLSMDLLALARVGKLQRLFLE